MQHIRSIPLIWSIIFLASCVTINVYFPAAAAEKAADKIIEQVLGEDANESVAPPAKGDSSYHIQEFNPAKLIVGLLDIIIPSAHAAANIDISSPAIEKLKSSMQQRHGRLSPHYKAGAIGYSAKGLVAVRDLSAVGLRDRGKIKQLVAKENRDRNALYKELASANGHPEWEAQIRATFARRWIAKAPGGWYYQNSSGAWRQK